MAQMQRPTTSYDSDEDAAARAFGYNSYSGEDEVNMRDRLIFGKSAVDPRMTNEQRLDQRYGNFQYGPTADYAEKTAERLTGTGEGAQGIFAGLGQQAWNAGDSAQGRTTPQTDYGAANATMGQQGDLYGTLMNYADQGPGASQAQAQLDASTARGMRQQLALAGSGPGMGGGAAMLRQGMDNQALMQGEANAQSAVLRAQEEDAWRGRQLQAYGMGGDVLQNLSGQQSQNAQFLTQAELEAQAQRDQQQQAMYGLGMQGYQQGYATQLGYEQQAMANLEAQSDANQAYEENLTNIAIGRMSRPNQEGPSTLDTVLGIGAVAAPALLAMSDERQKTGVKSDSLSSTYRAMGGTNGNEYDYTDEGWMQTGPEGYMHNGAAWKAERERKRQEEERLARFEAMEAERDKYRAETEQAQLKKKADLGAILGNALGGLRGVL
jgi:hypothetical protein